MIVITQGVLLARKRWNPRMMQNIGQGTGQPSTAEDYLDQITVQSHREREKRNRSKGGGWG